MAAASVVSARTLTVYNQSTGDGSCGFGIVAEYAEGGPRELSITRHTIERPLEKKPDYFERWGRLCHAIVFDARGVMVAYCEMGEQATAEQTYRITVPAGAAGVWRVAVSGGFTSDSFTIDFPENGVWGVRGEKVLKVNAESGLPQTMYMASLSATTNVYFTGSGVEWPQLAGKEGKSAFGKALYAAWPAREDTLEFKFDWAKNKFAVLYADGLPALLCPSREVALRLKGGFVQSHGEWFEGPLQARINDYLVQRGWKARPEFEPLPALDFLNYAHRNYEPGQSAEDAQRTNIAARAEAQARAIFCGLDELAHMDACGTIRGGYGNSARLAGERIDCLTMFEPAFGIGRGYYLAQKFMTKQEDELYCEAVLQVMLRAQGTMCYESNQFMHIIGGMNYVQCATQNKHLLRALKIELASFIADDFQWKHGQHASGFYSEESGPDGNYDQMSLNPLSRIYYMQQRLRPVDKELVALIRSSIRRNLFFRSLFCITDPLDGRPYQLAYSMNHRTEGPTHFDSHFGLYRLEKEFDLARTMLHLGKENKIKELPERVEDNELRGRVVERSRRVQLPFEKQNFTTNLPGVVAMKCGNFYTVHYYKSYDKSPDGFMGPQFIWHAQAGMGVCSSRHSYQPPRTWLTSEMHDEDFTFATVCGTMNGVTFNGVKELQKEVRMLKNGKGYVVTGTMYGKAPARNAPRPILGKVAWRTEFTGDDELTLTVGTRLPGLEAGAVNIPFMFQQGPTVWNPEGFREWKLEPGRFTLQTKTGLWCAEFDSKLAARVVAPMKGTRGRIMALRLPIATNAVITVRLSAKPTTP